MKNGRAVIFDLFATLLRETANDFKRGLEWLKSEVLADCTMDALRGLAEQFRLENMTDRTATYKEASHFNQLEFFKAKIGFRKDVPLDEIEWGFFKAIRRNTVQDGVTELLRWLKGQGYSLFVMSNTMFSSATIKRYLVELSLAEYFEEVYSSGDCGYRKPGRKFFAYAYSKIKKLAAVKKSEVVFIGNSLEKDMLGANAFGYIPVWLSSDAGGFGEYIADCARVKDFIEAKEYFESNYICIANVPKHYSVADGIGNRIVVYTQGCDRHCVGCHNENTWDFKGGKVYSIKELAVQILSHMSSFSRNVTISGGEPLAQIKPLMGLLEAFKRADINVCVYTGYEFDEVPDGIKTHIDYLKTGAYVHGLKTTEKGFFGSTNQKFWAKGVDGKWMQKL